MYFDSISKIKDIALKTGFSIFVVPEPSTVKIEGETRVVPGKNGQIGKEQVSEILKICTLKEVKPRFIVFESAETMNLSAENAMLKLLEEPKENYHLLFLVKEPSMLLKTVLSRARLFILKTENPLTSPVTSSPEIKMYAKKLITANPARLSQVMKEISSEKEYKTTNHSRVYTLEIVETAIEMLYKSYFETKNPELLKKLPNFLKLYDNLKLNGNIKLHLVADLC